MAVRFLIFWRLNSEDAGVSGEVGEDLDMGLREVLAGEGGGGLAVGGVDFGEEQAARGKAGLGLCEQSTDEMQPVGAAVEGEGGFTAVDG